MYAFQEDLFIYNQIFNLPHQITQAGTMQNIKSSFNHNKVKLVRNKSEVLTKKIQILG